MVPLRAAEDAPPSFARSQLYFWDPETRESYLLPGAGVGIVNAYQFGPERILLSRVDGTAAIYDIGRAVLIPLPDLAAVGFVTYLKGSEDGRRIVFQVNPAGTGFGPSEETRAYFWSDGALWDLPAVNAIGARHGGIAETYLSGDGHVLAFSTRDQGIYLYRIGDGPAMQVAPACAAPRCGQPALDRGARNLAWLSGAETLHLYSMPLEPTGGPGLGLRPIGPPRLWPEIVVRSRLPEIVRIAPTELGIFIGIQRLDLGEVRVFRLDPAGARIYLMATLNLMDRR